MKRHEYWRQQYRNDRYMEFLSQEELQERTKDIFSKMMLLSGKGKISLYAINDGGEYWMIIWTHVLEEFCIRYGPYPNGFTNGFIKDANIVNPTFPDEPKAKLEIEKKRGN